MNLTELNVGDKVRLMITGSVRQYAGLVSKASVDGYQNRPEINVTHSRSSNEQEWLVEDDCWPPLKGDDYVVVEKFEK